VAQIFFCVVRVFFGLEPVVCGPWPVARGPWPVRLPRRFAPRNDEVEFVQISCKSVSEKILSVFSVAL